MSHKSTIDRFNTPRRTWTAYFARIYADIFGISLDIELTSAELDADLHYGQDR